MKEQGKLGHFSAKRMSNAHPAGNLLYTAFGICVCLFQRPMFGCNIEPHELRRAVVGELQGKFDWTVSPESLVFLPGVVVGLNMACRAFATAGDAVLVQPPVYPGILDAPINAGLHRIDAPLVQGDNGQYTIDFRALDAMITSRTRLLIRVRGIVDYGGKRFCATVRTDQQRSRFAAGAWVF